MFSSSIWRMKAVGGNLAKSKKKLAMIEYVWKQDETSLKGFPEMSCAFKIQSIEWHL